MTLRNEEVEKDYQQLQIDFEQLATSSNELDDKYKEQIEITRGLEKRVAE